MPEMKYIELQMKNFAWCFNALNVSTLFLITVDVCFLPKGCYCSQHASKYLVIKGKVVLQNVT